MNKLLIGLLLCAGVAHAETFATQPNQAGGRIVLTDETCKDMNGRIYDKLNRAYNYGTAGYTQEGCWAVEGASIIIVWMDEYNNQSKRRYPMENFTMNPNWKAKKNNGYNY